MTPDNPRLSSFVVDPFIALFHSRYMFVRQPFAYSRKGVIRSKLKQLKWMGDTFNIQNVFFIFLK